MTNYEVTCDNCESRVFIDGITIDPDNNCVSLHLDCPKCGLGCTESYDINENLEDSQNGNGT